LINEISGALKPLRSPFTSISDLYSFDTDPVQHLRLNTDPDPDPIRVKGFDDQILKMKKIT
jgi:hypothetical protein